MNWWNFFAFSSTFCRISTVPWFELQNSVDLNLRNFVLVGHWKYLVKQAPSLSFCTNRGPVRIKQFNSEYAKWPIRSNLKSNLDYNGMIKFIRISICKCWLIKIPLQHWDQRPQSIGFWVCRITTSGANSSNITILESHFQMGYRRFSFLI